MRNITILMASMPFTSCREIKKKIWVDKAHQELTRFAHSHKYIYWTFSNHLPADLLCVSYLRYNHYKLLHRLAIVTAKTFTTSIMFTTSIPPASLFSFQTTTMKASQLKSNGKTFSPIFFVLLFTLLILNH